ncbi:MAG: VRR-NUC protein [Podoviridae sp. cty5g4]|nr:MAG: VRR-NUC protein [Podoviridae sp. cty5g4]
MKKIQSENKVKNEVIQYLESKGYVVYRINNVPVPRIRNGKAFFTKFHGRKGFPDLVAFRPEYRTLFIETKRTNGKPAPEQIEFIDLANSCPGNLAIWVDSLERLMNYF